MFLVFMPGYWLPGYEVCVVLKSWSTYQVIMMVLHFNVNKEIFHEDLINEARHPLECDFPFVVKGMQSMEQYKQGQMLVL